MKVVCVKCLMCGAVLTSKHRHDFQMCSCDNSVFIDGGSDYLRWGAKNMNLAKIVQRDGIIEHLFKTVVNEIFEEFCTQYRLRERIQEYNMYHGNLFADELIVKMPKYKRAIEFVLVSQYWFTDERQKRRSVYEESGYLLFLGEMAKRYNCLCDDIESGGVVLLGEDRIRQNELYRASEEIARRRFNEDTNFGIEVVKLREELLDLMNYLICGK